ncbi:hypothetical protein BH23GEM9_BH23GEM9_27120 [soil metagenome]
MELTRAASAVLGLAALLAAACARPAPPSADIQQRPFPDIAGRTVMLLPVQAAVPVISMPASADVTSPPALLPQEMLLALEAELGYWLQQRAPRVRWIMPDVVERAVRGSPSLEVRPRELTVRDFQRARLETIGDPLYGELRRMSALMDARVALLPVGALWIAEGGGGGRIHLAAALIDTFGGDVVWYGVVAGTSGARGDASVVASVAQALARMVPQ